MMVLLEYLFDIFLRPHYGPGVDTVSNRNVYQEYFLAGAGLTALPPSCGGCLETWRPETPGILRACPGLYSDCFSFHILHE